MPRPIDADALEKEIQELKKSPWYNGENGNYERIIRAEAVGIVTDLCVKQAPTLDYEPVRHGEWGEYESPYGFPSLSGFPCSVCGMHQKDIRGLNYCPNCGAKMDAKEDEEG